MGNVFIHATMSLDGFIAGPHDEVDWSFQYGSDEMAAQVMQEIGAVVMGNRGFREGSITENRLPYGGMKLPQFVVTHGAREPLTLGGLSFTFVAEGIARAVEMAKKAVGEKNAALLGASIGQKCLIEGLVDEIMLHVVPLLLGEGIRLFDHLGGRLIGLERSAVVATAGITSLRFGVIR